MSHHPDAMNDFRTERHKLPPEAFAISSGPEPSPTDPADKATWTGIVFLPDDVSLRTSDHHGETLHRVYECWGNWVGMILDVQSLCDPVRDPLAVATANASDEFQASIYAALTGFYRQAIGSLRPALEAMLAAVYFSVHREQDTIDQWLEGHEDARFWIGRVRRQLAAEAPFLQFEREDGALFADNGWFAWLYGIQSAFLHGRPAFTDQAGTRIETTNAGLWNSNGPIYSHEAFVLWSRVFFNSLLLSALFVGLADSRIVRLSKPNDVSYKAFIERLIDWHPAPGAPSVAATVAEYLMPEGRS
ncbi:MAG TPA: hypothetical protein VG147_04790 [Solirubrobacteraceae bacterium]|jgi:hypothetical protein|nr:hypothetical protein [Solirubrobacteraceae bacterium]